MTSLSRKSEESDSPSKDSGLGVLIGLLAALLVVVSLLAGAFVIYCFVWRPRKLKKQNKSAKVRSEMILSYSERTSRTSLELGKLEHSREDKHSPKMGEKNPKTGKIHIKTVEGRHPHLRQSRKTEESPKEVLKKERTHTNLPHMNVHSGSGSGSGSGSNSDKKPYQALKLSHQESYVSFLILSK